MGILKDPQCVKSSQMRTLGEKRPGGGFLPEREKLENNDVKRSQHPACPPLQSPSINTALFWLARPNVSCQFRLVQSSGRRCTFKRIGVDFNTLIQRKEASHRRDQRRWHIPKRRCDGCRFDL